MNWAALALGAAGLAVGEAVLSNPKAAGRVGGIPNSLSKFVRDFISVTVPGLPPAPAKTTSSIVPPAPSS